MRTLLLCLMLTACASPQRGEYRQSAAPMAPAFNPMTDSPHTVGQPGYIGAPESVPRSPHTRYLPPTKEPGLWAGDGPKAARQPPIRKRGDPVPDIRILTIKVPTFEGVNDGWVTAPTEQCAYAVEAGLYRGVMGLAERAMRLSLPQRECLVAMAHWQCLTWMERNYKDAPLHNYEMDTAIRMALDASVRWVARACPSGEKTPEIPRILTALEQEFNAGKGPQWPQ